MERVQEWTQMSNKIRGAESERCSYSRSEDDGEGRNGLDEEEINEEETGIKMRIR